MQQNKMAGNMTGVQLNYKAIVIVSVLVIAAVYVVYSWNSGQGGKKVFTQSGSSSWKSARFLEVPEAIKQKAKEIKVQERTLTFTSDDKQVEVFMRQAEPEDGGQPGKLNILLLHGAAFSSKNWKDLGTLGLVAAMGHRALAVDLPGYGHTTSRVTNRGKFLTDLIKETDMGTPVIVSPSMSGSFSIPYIMAQDGSTCQSRIAAYIPVAPGHTDDVDMEEYKKCTVPVLICYGSEDKGLGQKSLSNLQHFANNRVMEIEGAGHPAYIEKPDQWHKALFNFLNNLAGNTAED